jgi:DNA-binding transcriptional regulator YhcF (GntR family)
MEIRISKQSGVPVRQQLAEQITFMIATGKVKSGDSLPSVRELARRLKVHHNTVSEAYQDLVRRTWLVRHRGKRLMVAPREMARRAEAALDLDDLINVTIRAAREFGYSLQELRVRVRGRLLAQPPDHILVVEEDRGLREIIAEEIRESLHWPVESCSRADLVQNPGLAIGAEVVTGQYAIHDVESLV